MINTKATPNLPTKGILNDIISEIVPKLPSRKKSKILVVGCSVRIHFPWEMACQRYLKAVEEINKTVECEDVEIVHAPEPFEDPDLLIKFANEHKDQNTAGIILFHAAYTAGEIGSQLGRWQLEHPIPVLSWAWPEKGTGGSNEANSLTCQNFILGMWKQMGIRYAWLHQKVGKEAHPFIDKFCRAAYAKHQLSQAKLLHAGGSRVTAFYDGEVDELAVMRSMGVRFDRMDLEAVYQHSKKFKDDDIRRVMKTLLSHKDMEKVELPEEQMLQTYRFGLSILDVAAQNGYIGATVKSWPELFDCYGCAIDGSVSMMNDLGFCVTEEGEMNGLLSSLALQLVSYGDAVPTMMDLSIFDEKNDALGIWHCGASPTRWLKKGTRFSATKHSILENGDPETAVGLMLEFLLQTGPITVLRYQSPNASSYFSFEGEFIDTELAYRGNYGLMKAKEGETVQDMLGTIMSRGLDHHWSVGFGHWDEEIKLLNHFMGIEKIQPMKFSQTFGLSTGGIQ